MKNNGDNPSLAVINAVRSTFIPITILLATYAITGVHPFGDKLLMCGFNADWYEQLFRYHSTLTGDGSVFYTLSDGLGSQFYTTFANGFCNPFWLITAVFSASELPHAVPFIMIIESAFAGFFSYTLLSRLCPRQKLAASAFSAAYGGGSLLVLGFLAPQYTGAAVFLPLVGAGIYLLCEQGRTLLLFFSVIFFLASAATLWPTLLLFTVIFYVWCSMFAGDRSQTWAKTALLIVCLGLSFGSAAVLLMPTMITGIELGNLFNSAGDIDTASVGAIINSLFAGSFTSSGAAPLIFCSSMTLLMLPLYYLNSGLGLGERQVSFVSLIIVAVCFAVPVFGWVWLCAADTTGCIVGFGFVFCLIAVASAARSLAEASKCSVRTMMLSWLIIGILFGVSVILRWGKAPSELLVFSAAAITLMAAITLVVLSSKSISSGFSLILMFCIACECVLGGAYSITQASRELPLTTVSEYSEKYRTESWINSTISSSEMTYSSPFFRLRGERSSAQNSITSSASTPSAEALLDALGISEGRGFTPFTDALFGIKYIVSDRGSEYNGSAVGMDGDDLLFMNGSAMTIGYTVPAAVIDRSSFSANPFTAQNELASTISGANRELFHAAEIAECSGLGASITETLTGTEIIRSSAAGYVQFSVIAPSSGILYMYINCDNHRSEAASFNGQSVPVFLGAINPLGYCNRGDSVEVVMTVTDERLTIGGVHFAVLDASLCNDTIVELSTHQLSYVAVKGNHIRATVTVPEGQILMTTLPYQSGWRATADGEPIKTSPVVGALLALRMSAGTHSIELWYEPPYFTAALIISLIAFALGLIYATAAEVIRSNNEMPGEADAPLAPMPDSGALYQEPEIYTELPQDTAQFSISGQFNSYGEYVYSPEAQYNDFTISQPEQPYSADYFEVYDGALDFIPASDIEDDSSDEYYD